MNKKLKIILIISVIIAIVVLASSLLGKKQPKTNNSNSPLSSSAGVSIVPTGMATVSNDEFSNLLSSISRINIDTSLFDNRAYKLLRDFPVSLGSEVVGRTNPFAPIGVDSNEDSVNPTIQTIQPGKITATTAELGAQITLPDTVPTTVIFEYGTTDAFGSVTSPIVVTKSGTTFVNINKLTPETTYFVRTVASRGANSIIGNITTFNTLKR